MGEGPANLRSKRSRRDRPCDTCRRAKHTCHIVVRGEACLRCKRSGKTCTFDGPPMNRHLSTHTSIPSRTPRSYQSQPCTKSSNVHGELAFQTAKDAPLHTSSPLREFLSSIVASEEDGDDVRSDWSTGNDEYYQPLEIDASDVEESLYLGSAAFANLTMDEPQPGSSIYTTPASVAFASEQFSYRQVADPEHPVYFLRNPSKVYGLSNAAYATEKAYATMLNILQKEGPDMHQRLFSIFIDRTLSAIPIFNRSAGPFPHAILSGIMAHSAVLIPGLRHLLKELWGIILNLLDNEYRQPRLQTLQIALLDIYGRPQLNAGGNHPALCRAIGMAQLLGLHRNSAHWKLPKWEKSTRKRTWWALFVADKWNALVYGRPCNLHSAGSSIPQPVLSDDDWNECRLSLLLESLLSVAGSDELQGSIEAVAILKQAGEALACVFNGIDNLRFSRSRHRQYPGEASLQLNYIGIEILICRLGVMHVVDHAPSQLDKSISHVLDIAENFLDFLSSLQVDDHNGFWTPWSSFQISHAVSVLLRAVMRLQQAGLQTAQQERAWSLLHDIVSLVKLAASDAWEVAETAMSRVRILILSMPDIPGSTALRALVAPPPDFGSSAEPPLDQNNILDACDWLSVNLDLWLQAGPSDSSSLNVPGSAL